MLLLIVCLFVRLWVSGARLILWTKWVRRSFTVRFAISRLVVVDGIRANTYNVIMFVISISLTDCSSDI